MIKNSLKFDQLKKQTVARWLQVVLWLLVIFTFSSIQQVKVSDFFIWDFIAKKTAHITEFAILYLLVFRATGKKFILSFILTLLYAASDEIHQLFVAGRTASIIDIGFDTSGANIAAYVLWKLNRTHLKKQKK